MEEKLHVYQTAIKNLKVGSEDYLRVQNKIVAVEKGNVSTVGLSPENISIFDWNIYKGSLEGWDSDFLRLSRLDLKSLAVETLVALEWDTEFLALAPDGHSLAYTVNVQGASELYLLNLDDGISRQASLPDEAPGVVASWDWYLDFSPDGRRLLFSYQSAIRTSGF